MKFIDREFPAMLPRYAKLYAKKYPPNEYRKEVQGMVRVLQQRYGLTRREDVNEKPDDVQREAEQVGFAW